MRGAECNTDHMMVRVRLQFEKKVFRSGCAKSGERKFDVSKLKGRCMDAGPYSGYVLEGFYKMACLQSRPH